MVTEEQESYPKICVYCTGIATVANKIVERTNVDTEEDQTVLKTIYTCSKDKPHALKQMQWDCEYVYRRNIVKVENKKW